jgi:hypothetical protein
MGDRFMPTLRLRLAILAGSAVQLPWLLAHCGGGDTHRAGTDAGDAAGQEAAANDATVDDALANDATANDATANDATANDATANDATASDAAAQDAYTRDALPEVSAADALTDSIEDAADASVGDAWAGGQDAADGADGGAEATIDATPCQVGAGLSDAGDGGPSCAGMLTCCSAPSSPTGGFCTDTGKDPQNCGGCGTACSSTQFCTGMACDDAVLSNVCANPKATVVLDGLPPDDGAGNVIGMALATGCAPAVTVFTALEDSGVEQDPISGRPLTGPGNTLVAGGGWFGHASVLYMDGRGAAPPPAPLTPLVLDNDGTNAWIRNRKTSVNLVLTSISSLTPNHDYFLLELSVEPISGTLCFFGYGMLSPGTIAAGYYFQSNVLPSLSTFTDAWYVYEWTDTNGDTIPNAGDTFTLMGQGT